MRIQKSESETKKTLLIEFLKQKEIVFEAGALFLFIFLLIWNCLAFYFRRRTRGDSLQPAVDEIADGAMTAAFSI